MEDHQYQTITRDQTGNSISFLSLSAFVLKTDSCAWMIATEKHIQENLLPKRNAFNITY